MDAIRAQAEQTLLALRESLHRFAELAAVSLIMQTSWLEAFAFVFRP